MTVNEFMWTKMSEIKEIINGLSRPFDSHAFIREFSRKFQRDYVRLLSQYEPEPFKTVHQQIARFLLENQEELGITGQGKISSPNIFGIETVNEQWQTCDKK